MNEVLDVRSYESKQGGCSRQAIASVVETGPFPSSIYISASDAATGAILNLPVRIRKMQRISIVTKSRMMNIKEIQKI